MAKWIGVLGILVGAIGVFFGFYYLADDPARSLEIVTITTVGIVGVVGLCSSCLSL
ncbi:hypothetical protein [Desulfotalea psychrophila]|uniref:hypothetical protein n=1 Tax=Desulfotalea psychrophila TaxID=84980 RepID=UPI0002E9F3E7|nr:hypothetical protein [Desulfotalea psychrophila]